MKEIWKDIEDWEGIYQVSNHGRLKSFKRIKTGYVLSNVDKTGSYFSVVLCKKGRVRRSTRMHILVAEAFVPNPMNKPEVNHNDGNKQNNYYKNLEWSTKKENQDHAIRTGLADFKGMVRYNRFIKTKTVVQRSKDGRFLDLFVNCKEAAKATGVCARNIHQVAAKTEYKPGLTRKQAGGYRWEFIHD